MATFEKGQSFKGQRVHISSAFDQKGNRDGKNVAFSISNDNKSPEDVMTNPMLVYGTYEKDGKTHDTYTAEYSKSQWETIEEHANKEGDAFVLEADLFPNSRGPGLVINTNTLKTPELAFDADAHRTNTSEAREAKREAKDAAREAAREAKSSEQENEGPEA